MNGPEEALTEKLVFLPGSDEIKGGKKIHTFLYCGNGDEKFISSNLITTPFRFGLPENSGGKYVSLDKLDVIHKNQRKLFELYKAYTKKSSIPP